MTHFTKAYSQSELANGGSSPFAVFPRRAFAPFSISLLGTEVQNPLENGTGPRWEVTWVAHRSDEAHFARHRHFNNAHVLSANRAPQGYVTGMRYIWHRQILPEGVLRLHPEKELGKNLKESARAFWLFSVAARAFCFRPRKQAIAQTKGTRAAN